jgi:predicted RNase H-like HicB family nuclease
MKSIQNFTAIIEKEDDGYAVLCPESDIASQGDTAEEAKANLHEVIELFFEYASKDEIEYWLKKDIFITNIQIAVGQPYNSFRKRSI